MAACLFKPDVTGATEDELPGQSAASTPCGEQIVRVPRAFWGSEGLILPHSRELGAEGHTAKAGVGRMGRAARKEPSLGSCQLVRLRRTKRHREVPCPHHLNSQRELVMLAHAS